MAQLVEQRTENPCVPGSIPGDTTPKKSISLQIKSLDVERSPGFLFYGIHLHQMNVAYKENCNSRIPMD